MMFSALMDAAKTAAAAETEAAAKDENAAEGTDT